MTFSLARTDGVNSKNTNLQPLTIIVIRAEFDAGKRGKANAWRLGVTPTNYNRIGRRTGWKKIGIGTS